MGLTYPAERDSLNSGERSVAALPDRGRVLAFTSAGGAKPIAGWGGLEGFTPPHHYRRGQRLLTDTVHSPAPRVSASIRFAVRSLSEAIDRENTLREGERVCRSPHPPRSGPPSPRGEGQCAALVED